jgi:N-acetylglucosamine-6-sulfatase
MRTRYGIFLLAGAVLCAALGAGLGLSSHRSHAAAKPRPNILVLETDDQTLEEMAVLPNVQRLIGDQGVTFDQNFDSFALCCPSRATFLTGQYSHNNGVRGNKLPEGGYAKLDSTNTLAVWLQRAGYYTVHLGKYLNGYGTRSPTEVPPGWSEWHGLVDPTTYRYYGYTFNDNGKLTTVCARREPTCYQTDVLRDRAHELVRRRAPQAQPFFLWVAFLADHGGAPRDPDDPRGLGTPSPAPRHRNALAEQPLPMPPSFNEADVSDKPAGIRRRPLLRPRQIAAIRENWQQRRETLLAVDEAVTSIVDTLRQAGELDDTLILFTSDNGFFHGEHRVRAGKVLLYEPSIHLPLLMRWTGNRALPRGVHRSQLVGNIDDAATILDAADARPGRVLDGASLLPLWRDSRKELGRDLLVDNTPGAGHFDAIRSRHWLYAEYANGDRELYDLVHDPYELQSRHADPHYAAMRTALAGRLHALVPCKGASCRNAPRVTLKARGCAKVSVTGSDILQVAFQVNGKSVIVDTRRPFRVSLARKRFRRGENLVRARISVRYDRLVTRDALARCH